ncbi:MAG: ComEA family DNA-binding protein [Thermodesulfobacteriota bacterium]
METLSGADSFKDSLKESTLTLIILALFLMTLYIVKEGFFFPNIFSTPSFEKEYIKQGTPIYIQIEGKGVYTFPSEKEVTIKEVIDRSGLEYSTSPINNWNAQLKSGSKISIGPEMTISVGLMDGEKRLLFHLPIDINQATQGDFEALPGIGKTLARRIVKSRDTYGAFQSADDLKRVYGIGEKKLANIKELITASNSSYEITYSQRHP